MRLLHLLANCLEALRRHHEGFPGFVPLVRLLVDRKLIIYFVFLFFEVFLEMSVILSSQRYHYSLLFFVVAFFLIDTFILLLFDSDNFERSRVDMRCFFFLFDHEHNFRQIFDCIWNDFIDKLVVDPKKPIFQGLKCKGTRLCGQFCSGCCKFIKIGCDYLMQRFLF